MESAEMMEPFSAFASERDNFVLPTAVGPASTIHGFRKFLTSKIRFDFLSSSYLDIEMIVGLP